LPPVEYDHPFKGILIFSEGHDEDTMRRLCRVTTLTADDVPACVVAKTDDWCVIAMAPAVAEPLPQNAGERSLRRAHKRDGANMLDRLTA
jgi:hypothetical protein